MKLLLLENLKQSITHIVKLFKLNISAAPTGRPRKISKLDSLTLALYQHVSTRTTKRSVYEDLKNTLLCSYKTLVVSITIQESSQSRSLKFSSARLPKTLTQSNIPMPLIFLSVCERTQTNTRPWQGSLALDTAQKDGILDSK